MSLFFLALANLALFLLGLCGEDPCQTVGRVVGGGFFAGAAMLSLCGRFSGRRGGGALFALYLAVFCACLSVGYSFLVLEAFAENVCGPPTGTALGLFAACAAVLLVMVAADAPAA